MPRGAAENRMCGVRAAPNTHEESTMTINPSAFVLTVHEEHRRARFHAEAERERLGRLAQGEGALRPHWPDVAVVMAMVMALALLVLAIPVLGGAA
jgi:hypothetical protein